MGCFTICDFYARCSSHAVQRFNMNPKGTLDRLFARQVDICKLDCDSLLLDLSTTFLL